MAEPRDLTRQSEGKITDSGTLGTSSTAITPFGTNLWPAARRATVTNLGDIAMYAAADRMPYGTNADIVKPGDKKTFDRATRFIGLMNTSGATTIAWASEFEVGGN